jgi:hypothetical protein
MFKSPRALLSAAILIVVASLFILLVSTTATYTNKLSQLTGTPMYLPMVRKEATPTPTTPPPTADVRITDIRFDGEGIFPVLKEYVVIENRGGAGQNMTGWRLSDRVGNTYTFPNFRLEAGATVRVWSKSDADDADDLYWNRGAPVWDRNGDTAYLRDNTGTLVSTYSY